MAQKVLTWSNSQLMQFSRSVFIFCLIHVFESEFASGIKDVTFVLIYI